MAPAHKVAAAQAHLSNVRLAAILLALIALVHYSYDLWAMGYANQAQAARNIFYILRGVGGAVLFCIVGLLSRRTVVLAVCLFGAFEESQTAVCGLARGIDSLPGYEAFVGLCGQPMYTIGLWALVCLALYLRGQKNERNTRP